MTIAEILLADYRVLQAGRLGRSGCFGSGQTAGATLGNGRATALRFAHHGKGGVLVDLEGVQRIDNKKQFHGVSHGNDLAKNSENRACHCVIVKTRATGRVDSR